MQTERERERGRDTGRGRSRLHAESPTRDSIQGLQITPWAAGSAKPLRHRGCPCIFLMEERTYDSKSCLGPIKS